MNRPIQTRALPAQPFFATPQQRIDLARQRFFEDGVRPSGLVSEAVIQSWTRCLQAGHDPRRTPAFNPVTVARIQSVLRRNRLLLNAAANELGELRTLLAGTPGTAILTDAQGVVMSTSFDGHVCEDVLMPLAARVGVSLAEDSIGTNAPGMTAHNGQASVVLGAEHFCTPVHIMYCAAAPIRDVNGQLAAVLDISQERLPFAFDAAAVVGLYATAIENRLLCAQSGEHIVVQLQIAPTLLGTPMEGLVGVGSDGRIAWLNGTAARLLGVAMPQATPLAVEHVLGCDTRSLAALTRCATPATTRLPNGLTVVLSARMQAADGAAKVHSLAPAASARASTDAAPASTPPPRPHLLSPAPSPAKLRDLDKQVIEQTLGLCNGNISKAARQLGVSRGLIHRHLRRHRTV